MVTRASNVLPLVHNRILSSAILAQSGWVNIQLVRQKVTGADDPLKKPAANFPDPAYQKIDFSFANPQEAYRSKSNSELLRALVVFNICSLKPVMKDSERVSETFEAVKPNGNRTRTISILY